jgi:hypothetical protein
MLDAANTHLDISNLTYLDSRPTRIRRHSRKRGWRPPDTINVNITLESYDVIRSLAQARGQRNSPFYEEVREVLIDYTKAKEELAEKSAFLELAIEDKKQLRQELEKINLLISKFQDQPVSFIEESSRKE